MLDTCRLQALHGLVRAVVVTLLSFPLVAAGALGAPSLADSRLLAQLVPQHFSTLSAELAGRIERLPLREGQPFRRGDLLVSLDCSLQRAQRDRAVAQQQAARATHEANLELASLDAVGRVELSASEAALAVADAELRYLDVTLDKCRISAPWDGVAGEWLARPLEYVQAGQPILNILDPRSLQVEFIVPTAWLSWFTPGFRFALYVEELRRAVPLTLRGTAGRADPVSQSVKAVADLVEPPETLIAGMSGYLQLSPPENATATPQTP